MSKLDGLKAELGYFKFCFGIIVATFIALAGWIATNYDKADLWLVVMAFVVCAICIIGAIILNRKMKRLIKDIYQTKKDE